MMSDLLILKWGEIKSRIQEYIYRRDQHWLSQNPFDFHLLMFFIAGLNLIVILFISDPDQDAFHRLQHVGLWLLPEYAWQNITFFGDTLVALTIALIFSFRFPRLVVATFAAAIIGTLVIHGCKQFIVAPRPPVFFGEEAITIIGPVYTLASFPSGHTATAFILAGLLTHCLQSRSKKILLMLFATLVGYSRVVCGVHWPLDVVAGAAFGLFSAWFGLQVSYRLNFSFQVYLPIVTLLLTAAVLLINHTGDFTETTMTSQLIGVTAIGYWVVCWYFEIFVPRGGSPAIKFGI